MRPALVSKRPVWITLAVALLFHTLLLSLQTSSRMDTSVVRTILLDSLAPIEKLTDSGVDGIWGVWDGYFALVGVNRENSELRGELDEMRMQLRRQHDEVLEAQRLRELLDLRATSAGKAVVARVVGRDPTHSHLTFTIDKGKSHGVHPDAAVITPRGVVGRVISSGNFFSITQMVIDPQSAVAVIVGEARTQGIVRGTGGANLEIEYIDDDTNVQEGDQVLTSGLDRIYPKGIVVGRVVSVGEKRGLFKEILIATGVNLGQLEEVLCITEAPPLILDTGETEQPPATP